MEAGSYTEETRKQMKLVMNITGGAFAALGLLFFGIYVGSGSQLITAALFIIVATATLIGSRFIGGEDEANSSDDDTTQFSSLDSFLLWARSQSSAEGVTDQALETLYLTDSVTFLRDGEPVCLILCSDDFTGVPYLLAFGELSRTEKTVLVQDTVKEGDNENAELKTVMELQVVGCFGDEKQETTIDIPLEVEEPKEMTKVSPDRGKAVRSSKKRGRKPLTVADLRGQAKALEVRGYSRMSKDELKKAIRTAKRHQKER